MSETWQEKEPTTSSWILRRLIACVVAGVLFFAAGSAFVDRGVRETRQEAYEAGAGHYELIDPSKTDTRWVWTGSEPKKAGDAE